MSLVIHLNSGVFGNLSIVPGVIDSLYLDEDIGAQGYLPGGRVDPFTGTDSNFDGLAAFNRHSILCHNVHIYFG